MIKDKILILGGAGYIGSHVDLYLRDFGYSTLVIDNLKRGHRDSVLHDDFSQLDIRDAKKLEEIFANNSISAVMHFAAYAYVEESVREPLKYYENNVSSVISLLNCMKRHQVTKLVFSSSCAVYGNPQYLPIDEKHPQKPVSPYGWSKLMAERIMIDCDLSWGLKTVSLRYFNAAGEDLLGRAHEKHVPETHLIPLTIKAAENADFLLKIYGTNYHTPDGTCIRDYIHVTDLAQAHYLALNHLLKGGDSQAFNLGNGKGYSVREVIRTTEMVTGKKITYKECPPRSGDPPVLVGSSEKITKQLGWNIKIPKLENIIESAWNKNCN